MVSAGIQGPRAEFGAGAVQPLVQSPEGHLTGDALPGRSASGSQAGALHHRRDLRRGDRPAPDLADLRCAHGFLTLQDGTEVAYQMSAFYVPEADRGVRFDDPAFGIRWPDEVRVISQRDRSYPDVTL